MSSGWAINADGGSPAYSAQELRRIATMYLFPGVSDRFGARAGVRPTGQAIISVAGTTWTQHDLSAVVYPGLTSISGPYIVEAAESTGSLDPADGTNDRIDGLDLLVEDDDEDASGERQVTVVYVAGTPAGSPSAPAVTTNALRLGTILVPSGGSPSPSVQTQAQWTVATGGVLPVRDDTEGPSAGRYHGMVRYRQDLDAMEVWDGSAWRPITHGEQLIGEATGGSGSMTVSGIPDTYRHLRIVVNGRSTTGLVSVSLEFNGQADGNYHWVRDQLDIAGTAGAGNGSDTNLINIGVTAAGAVQALMADIPEYAAAAFTTALGHGWVYGTTDSARRHYTTSGQWRNAAPVTSVRLSVSGDTWHAASTMRVYGWG